MAVANLLIFIFEDGVPALTSHTPLAVEGIGHLGYPDYFRVMLTVFKVVGALVPGTNFISAAISTAAVEDHRVVVRAGPVTRQPRR